LRRALLDARDERLFLAKPPHLPKSETDQQRKEERRRNRWPQKRADSGYHD
jgi:hypothetical protein